MTIESVGNPLERRLLVKTADKEFNCSPELLVALDSDLGDAAKAALANPGSAVTVQPHRKTRRIAA